MSMKDDKDLLDEMALFIESDEELISHDDGVGFSDSKNDDDLLLQMEEFM
jgi:hypothetical protein